MHIIFIITLFAAATFAIVESDKKQQPPINEITLSYKNDTAFFRCRSYYGEKKRKLAITYNNGNSDEKKEIDSTYSKRINELNVPLNGTGIYECLTESKEGFTSVTVKLTNELNIFLGKNRDFKFSFYAYADYKFNSRTYNSFLYAYYNGKRNATVPCFKDDQALERVNLECKGQSRYMGVSPVSGVYKCIDSETDEVYGFEIRITSKSYVKKEGSAIISPAHCIRAQGQGFRDKSRHAEIDQIFLVLENDIAYLGCRSYLVGDQRRTLAITYDKGNGDEKKGIASKEGRNLFWPLKTKLSDSGIYECSVKDVLGETSATVKLTNELNIFPGKNRQVKFEFRADCYLNDGFRARNYNYTCIGVLHAKNNENQNIGVPCLKDDQPLEMRQLNHSRMSMDISPVSGVYKCTDNATREVYGFDIQIASESFAKNEGSASISPVKSIGKGPGRGGQRDQNQQPEIDEIDLFIKNDTAHLACSSYFAEQQRKLAIAYNNGTSDKKKQIGSTNGQRLIVPLNDFGIYECSVKNMQGEARATLKLTKELNIFQGKNRRLKFSLFGERYPDYTYAGVFRAVNNENQDVAVPCLKDDHPLETMEINHSRVITRRYRNFKHVSGVYKCVDDATGEVYGFEIRIANECE